MVSLSLSGAGPYTASMRKILVLCAVAIFLAGCGTKPENTTSLSTNSGLINDRVVHRSFFMDREFFDQAYQNEKPNESVDFAVAGIIPHHLLASHLIARFFLGLSNQTPSVVVVIGPNHFNTGSGPIISSKGEWSTPYGTLQPAEAIIDTLSKEDLVKIDERVFEKEHSISAEVSFIQKSFPRTTFVPIVLKNTVTAEDAKRLAETLDATLPDDALVLASVDFSHEVTPAVADTQAEINIAVLQNRDMASVTDMYVDSKPAILTLLEYVERRGTKTGVLLESSNAATVTGEAGLTDVTSYLTWYFVR